MDSDDRFEEEEVAKTEEERHYEQQAIDMELEKQCEEEAVRIMEWKHRAKRWNAPVKVLFT